jgi:hypothetical protein
VEKIKACKEKLSELKKYENIIKKKHVKSETLRQKGAYKIVIYLVPVVLKLN